MNFKKMYEEKIKREDKEKRDKEKKDKIDHDAFVSNIPIMFLSHLKKPSYTYDYCTPKNIKDIILNTGSVTISELSFYFDGEHPPLLKKQNIITRYDPIGSLPVYKKYAKVFFNEENSKIIEETVSLINDSNLGLDAFYDKDKYLLTIKIEE